MAKVFLTGGTGSLGSALIERLHEDDDVTVYSRDEVKQGYLRKKYPGVRFMLGDVRDYDRLLLAMRSHDIVIHAAAYKQVPSAEANVDEAIATNVVGSLNVARAAVHSGVAQVVGISTDKACAPINAYGQTKALMEKLFQQADGWSDTIFNCVRYGNVLGSRGSVVPLFIEQIAEGIPYTITDPTMTRFWMTMEQAVETVLAALDDDTTIQDGSILVPACHASTMLTLLEAVHELYGASSGPLDADDYTVIGTRPGEKQHECLIHANESVHTLHPPESLGDEPEYYQILPSNTEQRGEAFTYYSNDVYQCTRDDLMDMIRDNEDE